jgi:3,4-dihydroxy 2-butanone 4-phosphate synthase/GTP cyclohydrolase II
MTIWSKVADVPFTSDYGGDWRVLTYRNKVDGTESLVLQKGQVAPGQPTLVRVHSFSAFDDLLGRAGRASARCSARWTRSVARAPG